MKVILIYLALACLALLLTQCTSGPSPAAVSAHADATKACFSKPF